MNIERVFLENVDKTVNSLRDVVQIANETVKLDIPEYSDFSFNAQVLAHYISEFQLEWDKEAFDDENDEEYHFVSQSLDKIRQILADIKSDNQYKKLFVAEFAYRKPIDGDYTYRTITKNMLARTPEEASKEKDEIYAKTPKQHPDYANFTLEDLRVKVEVVDQSGKTILEEFLLN